VSLLDTLQLIAAVDELEWEFAICLLLQPPADVWLPDTTINMYGGVRIHTQTGQQDQLAPIFPRVQV
jgi:hypothetical protein